MKNKYLSERIRPGWEAGKSARLSGHGGEEAGTLNKWACLLDSVAGSGSAVPDSV